MLITNFKVLHKILFHPVEIYSLIIFRIGFGVLMFTVIYAYCTGDWIKEYFISPKFYFKYWGFSWISPLSEVLIYFLFFILIICTILITIGAFYRIAITLFFLGFSYLFLLDQTHYLNHFYMIILYSFLLCFMPAHHYFSVDAMRKPKIKSTFIPAWIIILLVFQIEIILIYAGIVKINPDWLQLRPLSNWLGFKKDLFLIGSLFEKTWAVTIGAYGVIILHILGAPLLLFKRTRVWVFIIYCCFHILNSVLFDIGVFPWLTILCTSIVLSPNWPIQFYNNLIKYYDWLISKLIWVFTIVKPSILSKSKHIKKKTKKIKFLSIKNQEITLKYTLRQKNIVIIFMSIWVLLQIIIPNRYLLYEGDVAWTKEGSRFSWRMRLHNTFGRTEFYVHDNKTMQCFPIHNQHYLSGIQANRMSCRPDMILQFAHHLYDDWSIKQGHKDISVHSTVLCSLNFSKPALFIDPKVDLAKIERNLKHADWILERPLSTKKNIP